MDTNTSLEIGMNGNENLDFVVDGNRSLDIIVKCNESYDFVADPDRSLILLQTLTGV